MPGSGTNLDWDTPDHVEGRVASAVTFPNGPTTFQNLLAQLQQQHEFELEAAREECLVANSPQASSAAKPATDCCQGMPQKRAGTTGQSKERGTGATRGEVARKASTGTRHDFKKAMSKMSGGVPKFALWSEWVRNHDGGTMSIRFDQLARKKGRKIDHNDFNLQDSLVRGTLRSMRHACHWKGGMIAPTSARRACWDFFGLLFLAFDLAWIPMQVFKPGKPDAIRVMETLIMLYWTLDIFMSFCTGHYQSNVLIMDYKTISRLYLRTWFVPDCSIVAIDWVLFIFPADDSPAKNVGIARIAKVMRILRITRTLRLLRVIKLREVLYAIQEHVDSEYMTIVINMLQNLLALIVITHYVACWWYLVGTWEGSRGWVEAYDIKNVSFVNKYSMSLHWSLAQFTPGGSRMHPQSDLERIIGVCILLGAILVGSTIISSITAAMTRLRNLTGNQMTKFFLLRKFFKQNQISRDLSTRLTRYIRLTVDIQKQRIDRSKVELLHLISGPLDIELQTELTLPTLVKHSFFQGYMDISPASMSQICYSAVVVKAYSKGDAIFHLSAVGKEMFFVQRGTLYYRRLKGVRCVPPRHIIDIGQWACEAALWVDNWIHVGTLRALIESEVLSVDSLQFREITSSYQDVYQYAKSRATHFVEKMREELKDRGHTWDIDMELISAPYLDYTRSGVLTEHEVHLGEVLAEGIIVHSSESEYDDTETEGRLSRYQSDNSIAIANARPLDSPASDTSGDRNDHYHVQI